MRELSQLPEVRCGDLRVGECELERLALGSASTPAGAWALLPGEGRGVVVLADRIEPFEGSPRSGLIVEAEVVGAEGTTLLRLDGAEWRAWRWTERPGRTHRFVERRFRSSRPLAGGEPPHLIYRQYWTRRPEAGILVWEPLGSCLVGFEEARG